MFAAVAAAVEQQIATISGVAGTADQSAHFVEKVNAATSAIARDADTADQVNNAASLSGQVIEKLSTRMMIVLRENDAANRRLLDRVPVNLAAKLSTPTGTHTGRAVDVSEGGLLVRTDSTGRLPANTLLDVDVEGLGQTRCRVVGLQKDAVHLAIDEPAGGQFNQKLLKLIADARSENDRLVKEAHEIARAIVQALERGISSGDLAETDLFDTDYQLIEGTNPAQHTVKYLAFAEKVLPSILEAPLGRDRRLTFCAAVDRNGYLPVHNRQYSQPQRPGDVAWNTAHSRNKRIFDDRAGLTAARNTKPFVIQSYARDMGGGTFIIMKEIDVPLSVRGRHWGGLRMAYKI